MVNNLTNSTQISEGFSVSQFFTTLSVVGILAVIKIIMFLIVRTKFKRIYEPKTYLGDEKQRVKPLPKTFYGWLPALLRMPQKDLIRTSGFESYFFARYIYVHTVFFLISFAILALILFPVYMVDGKGEAYGKTGFDLLTFGNISPHSSSRYGAPLALAYVFIGAFFYILHKEMRGFVEKRQAYLRSAAYQNSVTAKTVLITAIPKVYMSHDILFEIFNQLSGGVKNIQLNRNNKYLLKKIDEREKLVQKLETIQCKLIKAALKKEAKRQRKDTSSLHSALAEETMADEYTSESKRPTMMIGSIPFLSSLCFGKKVDAITYCKETISQLNTEIEKEKATVDNENIFNSAFIQFNKTIAAHMVVQSVAASIPLAMTPRYVNVKPKNIIWSNLRIGYYEKKFRELIVLAATAALLFFWTIPVTFVGFLSNITYLTNKLTFLQFIYRFPKPLLGFITGLLPSFILSLLMGFLANIFRLFGKIIGIPTKDAIDRYVQGNYFVFLVIHVFLVVSISSSFASVITLIMENPNNIATILATNVPTSSNFFFCYVVLQGLNMSSNLFLQFSTLIFFYLLGKIFDNTPRKKWKRYFTLGSVSWGVLYPVFTNFVVITLVYSIIAPLILLFSGLMFGLLYIAHTYKIFYVSDFSNDTDGLLFPKAIFQSFTGIYLMEIMLAGLFFVAKNESGVHAAIPEGILICILIVITIGVQFVIKSKFGRLTHYLPIDAEVFAQLGVLVNEISVDTNIVKDAIEAVAAANEKEMVDTYMHPVMRVLKPVIWLPQDNLGIAENEVQQTRTSGLDIAISTEGARFNEKIKLEIDGAPPQYDQMTEINNTSTHF